MLMLLLLLLLLLLLTPPWRRCNSARGAQSTSSCALLVTASPLLPSSQFLSVTFGGVTFMLSFPSQFQWVIYDCETRNVQLLEEFSPRPFFLKMYLPYFDMFAQGTVYAVVRLGNPHCSVFIQTNELRAQNKFVFVLLRSPVRAEDGCLLVGSFSPRPAVLF